MRNNSDDEELILSNNLCYGDYIDLRFDWFKLPVFFVCFFFFRCFRVNL